jgi:hypothetical protein
MAAVNLLGSSGAFGFLQSGGLSNATGMVMLVILLAIVIGIFGLFFWIFHPIFLYPYICPIQGIRNGVLKYLGQAYGREERSQANGRDIVKFKIWRLFKAPIYVEPVPNEYKVSYSQKRDLINFFQDNSGNLRPLQIVLNPRTQQEILQPNDKDVDFWMINEINSAVSSYIKLPSKFLQYLPIIVSSVFIVAIFVFMIVLTKQMGELVDRIGNLISALTAAFPK